MCPPGAGVHVPIVHFPHAIDPRRSVTDGLGANLLSIGSTSYSAGLCENLCGGTQNRRKRKLKGGFREGTPGEEGEMPAATLMMENSHQVVMLVTVE